MNARTPTTEVVKDAACFPRNRLGEPRTIDRAAFDRWLVDHERAVLLRLADYFDRMGDGAGLWAWERRAAEEVRDHAARLTEKEDDQ